MTTKFFEYAEEPPALWPELLKRVHASGHSRVRCRIPWSAHETVRGMRDFSKSSRLRLERFLSLAHTEGLQVEVELGFGKKKDAFPTWVWDLARLGKVPRGIWDEECSPFESVASPTLFVDEVREAFAEFVEDALSLLDLYRAPEGPIQSIELNPGPLMLEQSPVGWGNVEETFAKRFQSVEKVNELFQTSFRSFGAACTPNGLKTLWERRPWLAAWQFKDARKLIWEQRTSSLPTLVRSESLEAPGSIQYLLESTLIETDDEGRFFPFQPLGLSSDLSQQWFKLADYLSSRESEVLSLSCADRSRPAVVFCGRYLSQADRDRLPRDHKIFFPVQTPQYDENMTSLPRGANWISRPVEMGNRFLENVRSIASEALCP